MHDDLQQRLKRTSESLKPENLAHLLLKCKGATAWLIIDVQKEFGDPDHPEHNGNEKSRAISERIQSLAEEFRRVAPIIALYYKTDTEIEFYKFEPATGDTVVIKTSDSAFQGSDIKSILDKDGQRLLLTCGFNLSACVQSTVMDARKAGFDVCVLEDLTANTDDIWNDAELSLNQMRRAGAFIAPAQKVLTFLNLLHP
jgi:nicotinamidase-related amidase